MRRLAVMCTLAVAATVLVVVGTAASGGDSGGYEVRAIFDNAFTVIKGEDVRVSGVNVGKIKKLEVTPDNRAAVVLDITRPGFDDWRQDATCTIRPQGLIGERFVECTPTQPRPQGQAAPAALKVIPDGQPGAGQRLLPVTQTSKPVDLDLVNDIQRLPERQRLAIILNELGAGVAGRAGDLNETIRRANPALGATNRVLTLLGRQNQVLRRLAIDSDKALGPVTRERAHVADFIQQANTVSRATAERRADLERNFERLPRFLAELRPTMTRLQGFADEFQPVLNDLRAASPDINRLFQQLGPFSQASIPAIQSLGDSSKVGRPALVSSKPIVDDLRGLLTQAKPLASNLADLTTSLRDSGGIERALDFLFYEVAATNGYDSIGHYLRAGLIVNTCTAYSSDPQPGCSAKFQRAESASARAAANDARNVERMFAAKAPRNQASAARTSTAAGAKAGKSTGKRTATAAALKLPSAVLPGQSTAPKAAAAPAPATDPAGTSSTEQGLLDYLLGSGQ